MATTRTANTGTTQAPAASKFVNCLDCEHSILHRYGTNPILAACKCQPQPENERFPYAVEVASFLRRCSNHKHSLAEKQVEIRVRTAAA